MKHAQQLCMTLLRDKNSSRATFRQTAQRLAQILAHEAAEHLALAPTNIQTPLAATSGVKLARPVVLVPILRSGITLLPAFLEFFTDATVGVVGLKRDEKTAVAHWYYENFPPLAGNEQIIILDPMIATGGTGVEVLARLTQRGVTQDRILFASIICAPEGLKVIRDQFPDITLITTSIDEHLNATKFIIPGLGDFGDRYFGTE